MKTLELLNIVSKGLISIDQLSIIEFKSNNIGQLADWFGAYFRWDGYFKKGNYAAIYQDKEEEPLLEEYDIKGSSLDDNPTNVYLYYLD